MACSESTALSQPPPVGGRVFTSAGQSLTLVDDELRLTSVGIDIGSSTTHMVLSQIVLERRDNRYLVTRRDVVHESEVLLTPYSDADTLDGVALGAFFDHQYEAAGLSSDRIDTGALIMTGVAVRRRNARIIAEALADTAGRFVSLSAGDALECRLSAHGSGTVAQSARDDARSMNVDVGGGTSKLVICEDGEVRAITAVDVGARIVALDRDGRVERIEEAARRMSAEVGFDLRLGERPDPGDLERLVDVMAERLFAAMRGGTPGPLLDPYLRLDPLPAGGPPAFLSFSGGVAEYLYGREERTHGDLGPLLAAALSRRIQGWGPALRVPDQGIRATVVGASQYSVQVSGTTIFVEPAALLPVHNVPVITPAVPLEGEHVDAVSVAASVRAARRQFDDGGADRVAICYRWQGAATFGRLDAFCRGVLAAMREDLDRGRALILVGEGDVGGLVGIHISQELGLDVPVISVDGLTLGAFDFLDIGDLIPATGAVPVAIKSLVFPTSHDLGRSRAAHRPVDE